MKKIYYTIILLLVVTFETFSQTVVGPLLKEIAWDQEAPYYNQCPLIDGKRAFVGCGATAAGQVMKYYEHPKSGTGTLTIDGIKVDLSKVTYDWNKMLPTYKFNALGTDAEKAEVAKLLRHVGAAMNMVYSLDGSGSSLLQIKNGLTKSFFYEATPNIIYRKAYTDNEWFEVLKREIDAGRPIPFTGMNSGGGSHLFVCDGYKLPSKELHFNYGWDGRNNEWKTMSKSMFSKDNSALIGLHPTTSSINPTIVMFSSMNFSNYEPLKGEKFNVAARIANYGIVNFNNSVGVALYKGTTLVRVLKSETKSFTATDPVPQKNTAPTTYDLLFTDIAVPAVDANISVGADYQLRIVAKSASGEWCPVQGLAKTVTKEANVKIATTGWNISYPLGDLQVNLELTKPIEVSVANNRAVARFSIRNTDPEFNFENGDLFAVVSPNNKLIPATWKRITANIPNELTENFEISGIEIPVGVDIKTCRFSVAYSRVYPKLNPNLGEEEEVAIASVPLLPAKNNFKEYQIPNETTSFSIHFNIKEEGGVAIPADYKKYYANGTEDLEGKTWGLFLGKYTANILLKENVSLVTSAINVRDENEVLEWKIGNIYGKPAGYRIYISTEGQDYSCFTGSEPVYNESLSNKSIARFSLSEYAGKKIYIMFQIGMPDGVKDFYLNYFKILNIKSPKDLILQSVEIPGSITAGESFPVTFTAKNNSAINIKKVIATYTANGLEPVREEITTNIPFNTSKELTFTKPITVNNQAGGITKVNVHVELEGETDDALKNNDASAQCMTLKDRKSVV